MNEGLEEIREQQRRLYARRWDDTPWDGEVLYPPTLTLEEILKNSEVKLHLPFEPWDYNVVGTPRCGTKWAQKILTLLLNRPRNIWVRRLGRFFPSLTREIPVNHFHEGLYEDYGPDRKILFIYRDIRDAVVSGYHYVKNGLNRGIMDCVTENHQRLDKEAGLRNQLVMYMKYRMPVMRYWYRLEADNLVKVRYEDMLNDLAGQVRRINEGLRIGAGDDWVDQVIEEVSFTRMSGRGQGEENAASHLRKGIHGDWANHFSDDHREIFRRMGGEEFLAELGYEV